MKMPTEKGALAFFAASPETEFTYDSCTNCAFAQYLQSLGAKSVSVGGFSYDYCKPNGAWVHAVPFSEKFRHALHYGKRNSHTFGGIVAAYNAA